mmetsp:Transcript_11246/g.15447  ORF Transcript_11246/g.15447 Transcript_11246/m.15447 type:complete len:247 (+) Transcript_11246:272-1012(+)
MSNWEKLSASINRGNKKRKKDISERRSEEPLSVTPITDNIVALDCEMVGVGTGRESALARCTIIDGKGNVLYDHFVRPQTRITDFRTKYSGVRPKDLRTDETHSFTQCQKEVAQLLSGKLLIGHALENDLRVLLLSHPRAMMRDTAHFPLLMRKNARGKLKPRKLRDLAQQFLSITIQSSEHSSVEDANAALRLYFRFQAQWEAWILYGRQPNSHHISSPTSSKRRKKTAHVLPPSCSLTTTETQK